MPESLKARALVLISTIFILSHALSLVFYELNRDERILLTEAADLAQRIIGIVELANSFPADERQDILRAAQTQFLAAYPDIVPVDEVACQESTFADEISRRISDAFAHLPAYEIELCVRTFDGLGYLLDHTNRKDVDMLINIRFPDRETASFHALLPDAGSLMQEPVALYLAIVTLVALLLGWYLILRLIQPIDTLARAASEIGLNLDAPALPEKGPRELRMAAHSFNLMQARLQRVIHGQSEMFAAISHDLKSALTRLRLRAEMLENPRERQGLERVVRDMGQMIGSIIDFVRGDNQGEAIRRTRVGALVSSLCDDLAEEGQIVECEIEQDPLVPCRPLALRRAVHNLIENALKHAGGARVRVSANSRAVAIIVEDDGDGIPEEKLQEVLRPFVRVEPSRSSETGGLGLGLAITQKIVQGHGGTLHLSNRPERGLSAQLSLPLNESDPLFHRAEQGGVD